MAILRSVDGKFFEVPDKDLAKFEIPADQLREKLGDAAEAAPGGPGGPAGPGGPGGGSGSQVVIQIHGNEAGPGRPVPVHPKVVTKPSPTGAGGGTAGGTAGVTAGVTATKSHVT